MVYIFLMRKLNQWRVNYSNLESECFSVCSIIRSFYRIGNKSICWGILCLTKKYC